MEKTGRFHIFRNLSMTNSHKYHIGSMTGAWRVLDLLSAFYTIKLHVQQETRTRKDLSIKYVIWGTYFMYEMVY